MSLKRCYGPRCKTFLWMNPRLTGSIPKARSCTVDTLRAPAQSCLMRSQRCVAGWTWALNTSCICNGFSGLQLPASRARTLHNWPLRGIFGNSKPATCRWMRISHFSKRTSARQPTVRCWQCWPWPLMPPLQHRCNWTASRSFTARCQYSTPSSTGSLFFLRTRCCCIQANA